MGYLGKEVGPTSLPQNLVGSSTPHVCQLQHVEVLFGYFFFCFLTIITSNVNVGTRDRSSIVGSSFEIVEGSTFPIAHGVQGQNV